MAYCRKCGAQLKEDDVFCFMCGQPIDKQANADAVAELEKAIPSPESARPSLSKEESIALAEKLRDEYSAIERLQRELGDNQAALQRPVILSGRRYSAFRFFWPFLIYAYIALNAIYLIGMIISAGSNDETGIAFGFIIGLCAAVGLLIFGGIRAGRKRDIRNEEIAEEEDMIRRRHKDLETRTSEIITKLNNRKRGVSEYQNLVPIKYRTKHYMDRVLILIQTDRAAGFYEALEMLE